MVENLTTKCHHMEVKLTAMMEERVELEGLNDINFELEEELRSVKAELERERDEKKELEKFLLRRRTSCLVDHQGKVWSETSSYQSCPFESNSDNISEVSEEDFREEMRGDMAKAAASLRKLKNIIYSKIEYRKNVQANLAEYHSLTEEFVSKFDSKLSVKEAEAFRRRVRIARNAAKASKSKAKFRSRSSGTYNARIEDSELDLEELTNNSLLTRVEATYHARKDSEHIG